MPFRREIRKCPKPLGAPREAQALGQHLQAERLGLGLTQAQLAERLDVDESTILNWENGHTVPRIDHYARDVAFLGFDPQPPSLAVSDRLMAFRRRHGISQVVAAKRLGVDRKTWWEWEGGRRTPSPSKRAALERLLEGLKRMDR